MRGRIIGAIVGAGSLLLGFALGFAALPQIGAGQEYRQTIGWLDLKLDGLSLYFALLGLGTLGLALLAGRWAGLWQALPLAATYLVVRSYAGEWPLWLRLAAELAAAALLLVGLALVVKPWAFARRHAPPPSLPLWGRGFGGTMLVAWGMVGLAVSSGEPSAVAGGLILAAGAALLGLAISNGEAGRDKSRPYAESPALEGTQFNVQRSTFYLLPLVGLWLYLHAALARGELLYVALMLVGVVGTALGLLRLRPHTGWVGWLLAGVSVAGFAGGAALVDGLLRPALAGLAGLPAWSALKVQRLDLPAPQPDAAVGIGLQVGQDTSLLPLLALAFAFGFAIALGWLLYRLLVAISTLMAKF